MNSRANTNVVSEVLGNTGYSSVGAANDCKRLQRSEGPWLFRFRVAGYVARARLRALTVQIG